MQSSNLAPRPFQEMPAEDQPAPGTSVSQERSLAVPAGDTTPPHIRRRRRQVRSIVIRGQGLAPFRVY